MRHISSLIILFFVVINFFVWSRVVAEDQGFLKVAFLDVGQGDAIFIESPSGIQMLIDGGFGKSVLEELSSVIGFEDRSIDVVLATHPDADHIGGLSFVLDRFDVGVYVSTPLESETLVYKRLEESLLREEGMIRLWGKRGMFFDMGEGVIVTLLYPSDFYSHKDANDSSIVARISYGEIDFLLMGDASVEVEDTLISYNDALLTSEVLKLGHHGSRTSTSSQFLDVVEPLYAVISAGKDNRYGHPHKEVVELVTSKNILIRSTAENGTITFVSDGIAAWVE